MHAPSPPRARLTLQDLPLIAMSIGILGALTPVIYILFDQNADSITPGQAWLVQLIIPTLIIVLMAVIYRAATSGGT